MEELLDALLVKFFRVQLGQFLLCLSICFLQILLLIPNLLLFDDHLDELLDDFGRANAFPSDKPLP